MHFNTDYENPYIIINSYISNEDIVEENLHIHTQTHIHTVRPGVIML